MNKLYFIPILFIVLVTCQKEEIANPDVPDWFLPQIEELEKSGQCYGCEITQISYDNKTYYHLYCGYWSCMYCKLYDSKGKLVEWEVGEFNKFLENKQDEKVIWKCGDKLN